MDEGKKIGLWIRVSTDHQLQDDSPEHHEERGRLYAKAKGWEVVKVYRLDALSGKSVMDYLQTKEMLRDIKSGKITGLIFSKLARLARNTKELLEFSEIFREHNADLISLAESIDTSSPAGRLFYKVIASMAEWEREEIAERVAASVPIRANLGKPLGGAASFGYKWEKDANDKVTGFAIDEAEAPIRKLMYELFLKHKRKATVATLLNEKGFRTRNGSMFSDTTVLRLLRDPTAKGQRIANYTKSLGKGRKWIIKPSDEWIVKTCPAIVSEDIWNACNDILDEQEKKRQPLGKKAVHLFTSLLYCECGSKMYIPSNSKKYVCFSCKKQRISMNDLEEIYYENLKGYVLNEEQITSYVSKSRSIVEDKEQQYKSLVVERQKLQDDLNQLIELHKAKQIPTEAFGSHYNPLYEQAKQIDRTLPQIQAEIDFLRVEYLDSEVLSSNAYSLYENWPELTKEQKRQTIEEMTSRITLGKDGIHFKFRFSPATLLKIPTDSPRISKDSSKQST